MKHFLLTILFFASLGLFGEVTPLSSRLSPLTSPWTGGLNACQFGRMDLDQDGKKDLLVFGRHGNRLLCFINKGENGAIDYQYTTEYDEVFPHLTDWVVFADYDGDGKEDIFTYSKGWAGIKVYRNVSSDDFVDFESVIYPYLTSWQGGGEVNILATDADYPAIVDLDGDGDLDILTFGVMGNFIEKHLNLSVERYGCRDSLVFERTDQCWGKVAESEEDNLMYLDTCLFGYGLKAPMDDFRHRGATVTVRDMNGDGLLDLLLADVDYPELTLLTNGGDAEKALMVSQTDAFPTSCPVHLYSMPVPFFTDIDNDGIDDLLVSPFDPNPMASIGIESVWLYLNHGTNEHPDFQIYTKSFLQEDMLDFGIGTYPVIVDWDGDGLKDMVVGTIDHGLALLRNMGTATFPVFSVEAFQLTGLEGRMGLVPSFADLDGDGRLEMLVGTAEGSLMLFAHDGSMLDADFLHYDKPWPAPCFYDVDQDGVMDLVVGNASGKLSFYHSVGRVVSDMSLRAMTQCDFWGGVDVRDYNTSYYGYSVPTLFHWGDETLLAVGSESGKLFLFGGVSADENAVFQDVSERWLEICDAMPECFGMRSSMAVADLNGDGLWEVIVGNFAGGLQLFNADIPINNIGISEYQDDGQVVIFPNPVQSQIHVLSKMDKIDNLVISDLYGRIIMGKLIQANEASIDVAGLRQGVYLLRCELERGFVNRIFLKR